MAHAEINITLEGGEDDGGHRRYEPGSTVCGTVNIVPDTDGECKHLWARAELYTEGRGNSDGSTAHGRVPRTRGLAAHSPVSYDFELELPREPWSYAGRIVSIVWKVEASIDVPWSIDPSKRETIILAPRA